MPQQAVRVGHFEQTMDNFNKEMAAKYTHALYDYHNKFIAPEIVRISGLEKMGWFRLAGLLILLWADWRIALGVFLAWFPGYAKHAGRFIMGIWVKLTILTTWEISDEDMQGKDKIGADGQIEEVEAGWQPVWYQGLARRLDSDDGFVYRLKPLHLIVRFYDGFVRRSQGE